MVTDITGDTDNAALAAALLARKEELGVTFEQLAEDTGLGVRTVKRYFHDERVMTISTLRLLAGALDLPFGQFMADNVAGF